MTEASRYQGLRDYWRVIRSQWLLIALLVVVAGGAAYAISARQTAVYEASAGISFQDETRQLAVLGGSAGGDTAPGDSPQARAQTLDEPAVLKRVDDALPDDVSRAQIEDSISTSLDSESFLVNVMASSSDPGFAADVANEFARQAAAETNQTTRGEYAAALKPVQQRLDDLGNSIPDQTESVTLTDQISRLRFLADNARPARVVKTASVPEAPVSPKTARNTGLGLLLGLVIGIAVAFLRDSLDRRLHGSREAQEEVGYPLLGNLRDEAMGHVLAPGRLDHDSHVEDVEAIRILRQNLDFLASSAGRRKTVLITSPLPAEGKSTVAASLACVIAASGRQTLLVECDLRRPSLAERLGIDRQPGLTDYLLGAAEPQEILRPIPLTNPGSLNGHGEAPGVPSAQLSCITAGSATTQPAELIGSQRFREFLDQVGEVYETVIIDSSPLLPVADTLEILPLVDAVLLCIRSSQTTRDQAAAARAALEHFPDRPTGVVVTGLRKRQDPDYSYSYGYAYRPSRKVSSGA